MVIKWVSVCVCVSVCNNAGCWPRTHARTHIISCIMNKRYAIALFHWTAHECVALFLWISFFFDAFIISSVDINGRAETAVPLCDQTTILIAAADDYCCVAHTLPLPTKVIKQHTRTNKTTSTTIFDKQQRWRRRSARHRTEFCVCQRNKLLLFNTCTNSIAHNRI